MVSSCPFQCSQAHDLGWLFGLLAVLQDPDLEYVGVTKVQEAEKSADICNEAVPLIVVVLN